MLKNYQYCYYTQIINVSQYKNCVFHTNSRIFNESFNRLTFVFQNKKFKIFLCIQYKIDKFLTLFSV